MDVELNALSLPGRDAAEQQRALTESLLAAPMSSVRPSTESVSRLGATLTRVVPSLNLTAAQRRQLAIDINLALNSGTLSPAETQRVLADARGVLQPRNPNNTAGVEQLMGDLNGVISELQGKGGDTSQAGPVRTAPPGSLGPSTQTGQGGGSQTGQGTGTSHGTGQRP